ncbi:NAD(P)-dependent oxidoreductase [Streptomyces chumphonensis]|uniref:NAD(P)-dependent oxidoreductase n=1 Tax=Streptomyces chumphonensis TaxID=1214925 RepID=UPI003D758723
MTREPPLVVLLTALGESATTRLRSVAEVVGAPSVERLTAEERRRCRVVVLRSETTLGARELAELPALTDVVRPGSGVDNIAVDVLRTRGIALHRNADASADAVAELAVTGLTVLCRRMGLGHRWLLEGSFAKQRLMGESVAALSTVIWGAGPIGRAVYRRLRAGGHRADFVRHPSVPDGLPVLAEEEALAEADVHVLALPLRPRTRGIVDADWLGRASGRRPYLVNVGRHELLDPDAVARALCDGRLRGCYLDPLDASQSATIARFLETTRDCNVFATQHQGAQRSDIRGVLDAWVVETVRQRLHEGPGAN